MNRAARGTGLALAAALAGSLAWAQTTVRESVSTAGAQGNGPSRDCRISRSGRFVSFGSQAWTLVPGDTNLAADVFVRDRWSGMTERVSLSSSGVEGDGVSWLPSISADGRFVAFYSHATNLVAGDTNGKPDIFVRDRVTATTERVSVSSSGVQANNESVYLSISDDGRFVAFESVASNLVAGDTNGMPDIFVRDRSSGTTERVSVGPGGLQADQVSGFPAISGDGRFVAFSGLASNLVTSDTNGTSDAFVHDRFTGVTELVGVSTGGTQGNLFSSNPSISSDGRFVAFLSDSTNLVTGGDGNLFSDVYLRDRSSGTTELLSFTASGAPTNNHCSGTEISADGRFIGFWSTATNLVPGDTNGAFDVFVRDRQSGTTERVSLGATGSQGGSESKRCSISADGRFVAFESDNATFVAGDTNFHHDAFVRDRVGAPLPIPFCSGDGSGTACPCGAGAAGNGCPSSVNASGARLSTTGNATATSDTFVLLGTGMPDGPVIYLQGTTQSAGGAGIQFGDGLRCVGNPVIRLGRHFNSSGASQHPTATDPPISVTGAVAGGDVRTYQAWYRNAAVFCTSATFNLTNGVQMTWEP